MLVLLPWPAVVYTVRRSRRRRHRLILWAATPADVRDHSYRGYKVAQFVVDTQGAHLIGVLDVRYDVDDRAVCLRKRCAPPGLDCVCGFYAFKDRTEAVALLHELHQHRPRNTYVLLSADLDGEVLEYERGYRAQRQRIVRIEIPNRCSRCRAQPPGPSTVSYVSHSHFRTEHLGLTRDVQTHSALPPGSAPLRALCPMHTPPLNAQAFTLADLRGRIGTEVTLLPITEHPPLHETPSEAA
ncbi:MAG: hypothetical protein WBG76_01520 [Ornithinimicrobium sp.]